MIETYLREYLTEFCDNPKELWNYEAGVLMLGAQDMYEATGEIFFYDCIVRYMDHYILPDGTIRYLDTAEHNLDKINTGRILFFLYEKTGQEKYRIAIETLMKLLKQHPRTSTNNFWHKEIYPYQIWLDGLYMALPLYMEYETRFCEKEHYNDIYMQLVQVRKLMYDQEKELYYHAYDEKKQMIWADPETGLSHNFWLRSIGWHLMALIDLYEISSEEVFEQHKQYAVWFKEALKGVLKYQDPESKLFYQLVDLPSQEGNYLETSGTAMIAYCILKGCRMGVLQEEKYRACGEEILSQLIHQKLIKKDGTLHLIDMCKVAGLGPKDERDGSVEYYLSEPIVADEEKGVGAMAMAWAEHRKLQNRDAERR